MSKTFWLDAIERIVATFVEAFCGTVPAFLILNELGYTTLTNWQTALVAGATSGVIAVLSAVKAIAASFTGDRDTASFVE